MPRHLILIRHGKADQSRAGGDHERALQKTGAKDVAELRSRLGERGLLPDLILCSDSRRTIETASGIADATTNESILSLKQLYLASTATIIEAVREYGGSAEVLAVVAHNPAIETLTQLISPGIDRVRPGSALICELEVPDGWHRFTPEAIGLKDFLEPSRYSA
jgi:phosphohistidine phosphatase